MGNAGVARLILSLKDRNVDLWTETAMTDLINENGAVIGIKATKNNVEIKSCWENGDLASQKRYCSSSMTNLEDF